MCVCVYRGICVFTVRIFIQFDIKSDIRYLDIIWLTIFSALKAGVGRGGGSKLYYIYWYTKTLLCSESKERLATT